MSLRCENCLKYRCSEGCKCDCHFSKYGRFELYGKNSTPEQIRKHIVELRIGNKSKKIAPLNPTEIARRLGKSREFVYSYLKEAEKLDEVTKDSEGKIEVNQQLLLQKQFKDFNGEHPITADPYVASWIEEMQSRGHGGKPIKSLRTNVRNLERFCNGLKIEPQQACVSKEVFETYLKSYKAKLVSGELKRTIRFKSASSVEQAMQGVKMSMRSFVTFHGVAIPRGTGGIISGKIIGHAQYGDIRLTDDELKKADEYLLEKYGLDSDIYRLFWVGVESCCRKAALLSMALEWTENVDDDEMTFFMTAFEAKTDHIRGGKWDKFIMKTKTQESLRLIKKRNKSDKLYDEPSADKMYRKLTAALKDLYKHLGKVSSYFFEHAVHALRHIGAHYWLRKTDYNYGFVAEVGGWHTIDELKLSYGLMPPEIIMKIMKANRKGLNAL